MTLLRYLLNMCFTRFGYRGISSFGSRFYTSKEATQFQSLDLKSNPRFVDTLNKPPEVSTELALRHLWLVPDFISEDEELSLLEEMDPILRAKKYENDHFDDAIHVYRETDRLISQLTEKNRSVVLRMQQVSSACDPTPREQQRWMPHIHVLDLSGRGVIKPHVDSVRFAGPLVVGLSLISDAVMRFVPHVPPAGGSCGDGNRMTVAHSAQKPAHYIDIFLKHRALYVMSGIFRYEYTHAVLSDAESYFQGVRVPRKRRIAILTRSMPPVPAT